MVNGNYYSGSSGPVGVEADGEISWSLDDQVQRRVGQFALECFQLLRRRRVPRATFWSLKACTIGFRGDGTLSVDDFATENAYDYVEFDGNQYPGLTGPEETPVTSDSVLIWTSDYSTTHKVWRMCTEVALPLAIRL